MYQTTDSYHTCDRVDMPCAINCLHFLVALEVLNSKATEPRYVPVGRYLIDNRFDSYKRCLVVYLLFSVPGHAVGRVSTPSTNDLLPSSYNGAVAEDTVVVCSMCFPGK